MASSAERSGVEGIVTKLWQFIWTVLLRQRGLSWALILLVTLDRMGGVPSETVYE